MDPLKGDEMRPCVSSTKSAPIPNTCSCPSAARPLRRLVFAKLIERAGVEAGFEFGARPHMLRHACGYKLANDGHDTRSLQAYLGHRNIQHTVRYSEMSPTRFKNFWRD
jgi:site-specific recombinase XerD